jgi:CO dehydrogenase/acetyl-CoA synthase beta subunit
MAKGLRSKCKRANRAQLRKTLSDPIIKKRAENIAIKIKEGLENKAGVTTINALKNAFKAAGSAEEDMIVEEDEEEEEEEEEGVEFKSNRTLAKEEFIKKRGSKARVNPGKELVWFK